MENSIKEIIMDCELCTVGDGRLRGRLKGFLVVLVVRMVVWYESAGERLSTHRRFVSGLNVSSLCGEISFRLSLESKGIQVLCRGSPPMPLFQLPTVPIRPGVSLLFWAS